MSDVQQTLERCFLAVFPDLTAEAARSANAQATPGWDSTALVTLMSVIEEECGIVVDPEDLQSWTSFAAIQDYLTAKLG